MPKWRILECREGAAGNGCVTLCSLSCEDLMRGLGSVRTHVIRDISFFGGRFTVQPGLLMHRCDRPTRPLAALCCSPPGPGRDLGMNCSV